MSSHTHVQNPPSTIPSPGPGALAAPSVPARTLAVAAAALTAAAAVFVPAAPALAHDELVDTGFVTGPEDGSLEAVQLTFNNEVLTVGTEIVVTGPEGADASGGDPEHRGRDVLQPLVDDLPEGDYDVVWRVVSSDGHPIEGAFSFEFEAGQTDPPEIEPFDEETSPDADEAGSGSGSGPAEQEHEHGDSEADHQTDSAMPGGAWAAILIGAGGIAAIVVVLAVMARKRRGSALGGPVAGGSTEAGPASTDSAGTDSARTDAPADDAEGNGR